MVKIARDHVQRERKRKELVTARTTVFESKSGKFIPLGDSEGNKKSKVCM